MRPQDAHIFLENFCKDDAGIGISIDIIERILREQVSSSSTAFQNMPSNETFKGYDVAFDANVDLASVKLKFDQVNGRAALKISNFQIAFTMKVDKHAVANVQISYSEVLGLFDFLDRRITITPLSDKHTSGAPDYIWEADSNLKDMLEAPPYSFEESDWDDLKLFIRAAILNAASPMARSVVEALELPDFLEIFVGIIFGNDSRFEVESGLLMFSASSTLNFDNCPSYKPSGGGGARARSAFDGNEITSLSTDQAERLGEDPGALRVDGSIGDEHPDYNWPVPLPDAPMELGHVFLFTPVNLLRVNFDGALKPAVNTNDRRRHGPFFTHYSLTAALDGPLTLDLVRLWPIVFQLRTSLFTAGQAGAGIKIGSIWYEAIGARFTGRVNLGVEFSISYDPRRKDIVFVSRVNEANAYDFFFANSLPWPLSSVANWILERVVEKLLPTLARRAVSVSRIPIAELGLLAEVADLLPGLAGHSDTSTGNATFGVALDL
ncbi:hypothetical protein SAMN04488030_3053 [Aliiroseovarius halocynthiae]|uniref:Uncharacterized protein n=1 Tax=Aliiroseovarius halocynthiae TaxID=985055 RepID=A0A545SMK5_9RHOB|nr:hypothetical protein [Aliiroseovarius halocynthiae]TQV66195.1 hypothetical protein FIL88_14160 [Aliiroseovarius halocynthiae]SMR82692.1 hypothetical protein SAMN04488030_3053 [Aliiroseovarius halocynthiae]